MTKLYNIGDEITAVKHGKLVEGVVVYWRSKYGGKVQYKVAAAESIYLPFSDTPRDIVLVDEDDVIMDFGVIDAYA